MLMHIVMFPKYFNPLPPCGGRPSGGVPEGLSAVISIHSLRVEGDDGKITVNEPTCDFNPLPPCGGRPISGFKFPFAIEISIHSLRVEGDTT